MTSSSPSGSDPFDRLHPALRRWIWDQGWTALRDAQTRAIPPILEGRCDVVISAATASGKTEAAFLPILSALARAPGGQKGVAVLALSPLKALINDQYERLGDLCRPLDIPVTPWHGDVGQSVKRRLLERPEGVLLITPESLEALLVLRGAEVPSVFADLRYVVVDELHTFIGSERGAQVRSQLHRIEDALHRRVPRIGLSATLGDLSTAGRWLRPGDGEAPLVIEADDGLEVRLALRGYVDRPPDQGGQRDGDAEWAIAADLYRLLAGSDNLVFANSRREVEVLADHLQRIAEEDGRAVSFPAHHGSLSKALREDVEAALKDRSRPVSAVCTSTLEMGIDVGSVASIAQVGPPPAVATLRQRLGRSGRRGEPAVLRLCVAESEIGPRTPPPDALRASVVQAVATVELLLGHWYEPPAAGDLHLSTLVQQLLSSIAQVGGLHAAEAYRLLCGGGTFPGIDSAEFAALLRHLGGEGIVAQAGDGALVLGARGERLVNHFAFYAAFTTAEEWRLSSGGHQLGTLPIEYPLTPGRLIIFAGRRWQVGAVDAEHRSVDLLPAPGGRPPRFEGGVAPVHDRVRAEMLRLYQSDGRPSYLDPVAADLLEEGRANFARLRLDQSPLLADGRDTYLFLWAGDRVVDTVALALGAGGLSVTGEGLAVRVAAITPDGLAERLRTMVAGPPPDGSDLARHVTNLAGEKHDRLLPPDLARRSYAARRLDVAGAWQWLRQLEL